MPDNSPRPQKKVSPADVVETILAAPIIILADTANAMRRADDRLKDWYNGR